MSIINTGSSIHGCSQARRRIRCLGSYRNPVDPDAAYVGNYDQFGHATIPCRQRVGGTMTFGGGLALYSHSDAVGGLGLSGDTAAPIFDRVALAGEPPAGAAGAERYDDAARHVGSSTLSERPRHGRGDAVAELADSVAASCYVQWR